jgi:hypothetical protein
MLMKSLLEAVMADIFLDDYMRTAFVGVNTPAAVMLVANISFVLFVCCSKSFHFDPVHQRFRRRGEVNGENTILSANEACNSY